MERHSRRVSTGGLAVTSRMPLLISFLFETDVYPRVISPLPLTLAKRHWLASARNILHWSISHFRKVEKD